MQAFIRASTVVVAQGLVAVALLAGCDGDDTAEATRPATDQRSQAEADEWSAHLRGHARSYVSGQVDPVPAGSLEAAEDLERTARLDGHARAQRNGDYHDGAPAPLGSSDEFVPGSRRMPR